MNAFIGDEYVRRAMPSGTESICMYCYQTVRPCGIALDIVEAERLHLCPEKRAAQDKQCWQHSGVLHTVHCIFD
jgi:hypothetical protein